MVIALRQKIIAILTLLILACLLFVFLRPEGNETVSRISEREQIASVGTIFSHPFRYQFTVDGVLEEAGAISQSSSPYWWVNSGGELILNDGVGMTIQGEAARTAGWGRKYAEANPIDTDGGSHPQNIFRMLTKSLWKDSQQEVQFKINKVNISDSSNRNESNGVFLIHRYEDQDNLYYLGIRVDGDAVIKKKKEGIYHTLGHVKVFQAEAAYNRNTNPNMIPGERWLGLRSQVWTDDSGVVHLTLFIDKDGTGEWTYVLSAQDDGESYGGGALTQDGLSGIRTDFMDLEFDDYLIGEI